MCSVRVIKFGFSFLKAFPDIVPHWSPLARYMPRQRGDVHNKQPGGSHQYERQTGIQPRRSNVSQEGKIPIQYLTEHGDDLVLRLDLFNPWGTKFHHRPDAVEEINFTGFGIKSRGCDL